MKTKFNAYQVGVIDFGITLSSRSEFELEKEELLRNDFNLNQGLQ